VKYTRFTGKNTVDNFYARDFRNNYRFRPEVNPPRQQFQGYVNFIFNRNVLQLLGNENLTFKTSMSSLVRTAQLPAVDFNIVEKNNFNKKRNVTTGVTYAPVDITVFDTVNNEWLTVLMKYFSYLHMDPRNKNSFGDRDINFYNSMSEELAGSNFGAGSNFNSNEAGLNLQVDQNFFERIDYILYAGGKGVQYSLMKPMIKSFAPKTVDYSSSDFMDFSLNLVYENFTTFDIVNFDLGEVDLDRFEDIGDFTIPGEENLKPISLEVETDFAFLGNKSNNNIPGVGTRPRSAQPLKGPSDPIGDWLTDNLGDTVGGFLGDTLSTAVGVKPTYGDWKDKVENDLIDSVTSGIANAFTKPPKDSGGS
jgi:hypothetical protein